MKIGRFSAIASACIVAAATFSGLAGAETASAASYTHLCVDSSTYGSQCADSLGGLGYAVEMVPYAEPDLTNWTIPTVGNSGAIRQADNVNFCMQIDASSAPYYFVNGGSCNADAAEQWKNYYIGGRTVFESVWGTEHNLDLCLGFNASIYVVSAAACSPQNGATQWYQEWNNY